MTTVAEYLYEKVGNFSRWLKTNGHKGLPDVSPLTLVAMAQELGDYEAEIKARDFDGLERRAPMAEVADALRYVRERQEMHDKFWRYLELFSDTVN